MGIIIIYGWIDKMPKKYEICQPKPPSKKELQEQAQENYERGYSFHKPMPPRSPVDSYVYNYIKESAESEKLSNTWMTPISPQERALVLGKPDKMPNRRSNNSYAKSAPSKGGHRIGARKK